MQIKSSKDFFYFKKSKSKNLKSILLYNNMAKPSKKKIEKIKKRGFKAKGKNVLESE